VSVTPTFVPGAPEFGLIDVNVGACSATTVNACPRLLPPPVVTPTKVTPTGAHPAITNVAVICVELPTLTLLTVM